MASLFTESCISALMVGNGISGLLIALLRLVCYASFGDNSLLLSTSIYFGVSALTVAICIPA